MTVRGAFIPKATYPYFEEIGVAFNWYNGFSMQQKQRCATAMHTALICTYPDIKPLEISSSSGYQIGQALSAMHIKKWSNILNDYTSVESAFQSSRIYITADNKQIGPFPEYLGLDGKACKRLVKEKSQGLYASEYIFEGLKFPVPDFHISLFYDYIYLNALLEEPNRELASQLISGGFNCFTDLATKALNSQARSCALFVSLYKLGLLDKVQDYNTFLELFRVDLNAKNYAKPNAYENRQLIDKSYPLGVTQYRNVTVQRYGDDFIQNHFSQFRGIVTLDNMLLAGATKPKGAIPCIYKDEIKNKAGTTVAYILQDMQGNTRECPADKTRLVIQNGDIIVLNKYIPGVAVR